MSEVQKGVLKESRQSDDYTLDGLFGFAKGALDFIANNPMILQKGLELANAFLNPGSQGQQGPPPPPPGAQPQGQMG